jgi:glycosyltransferase involved in cell wall biosynthesis
VRIALLLRPDADARLGGDVVQAHAVARYLREHGAVVDELTGWRPPLDGYDVAVVMNLTVPEQAWLHAAACRRAGVPYVLLPVFWDLARVIPHEQAPTGSRLLPMGSRRRGTAQRLRLAATSPAALRTAGAGLPGYLVARSSGLVAEIVRRAAAVLPNSAAERDHLAEHVGCTPGPHWAVAHNGLWADELPPLEEALQTPRKDVVLSVGAISPRKNTLGLVRAARELPWPVEVIGQPPHARDGYARRVLEEAPDNVHFVGLLPRDEVLRRLTRARLHVQPGFVETPGLASLEAAALGTPVVVSDTAPVREYFLEDASYADPHSVPSLIAALRAAWERPPDRDLAERVRRCYDWRVALAPLPAAVEAVEVGAKDPVTRRTPSGGRPGSRRGPAWR